MKICDISSFYSELGGGVRTYHHQKLSYFEHHPEHEYVMIIAGPRNDVEQCAGGRIYRVRGLSVSRRGGYRQLADFREIRRILRIERPQVIEVGSAYLDCWLALNGGADWNPLYSGFYHADFPDSYMAPAVSGFPKVVSRPFVGFWKKYVKYTYERFDVTCVTSKYIEEKLKGYGVKNTFHVPLGVDSELFSPEKRDEEFRRQLGVKSGDKLALYVGRFWSEKGIDVLTPAIKELGKREDLHIVLVGDGTLESQVRAAASSCPRIHFLGFIRDSKRLSRVYASADLFLSPGPYETFGLSTVEAMSSGIPVVAAASGGAGESVGASGAGLLFKSHDTKDFIRQTEEMLGRDLTELGQQARRFVEQSYSWESTFQRMVEHYEELGYEKATSTTLSARRIARTLGEDRPSAILSPGIGNVHTAGATRSSRLSRPMATL